MFPLQVLPGPEPQFLSGGWWIGIEQVSPEQGGPLGTLRKPGKRLALHSCSGSAAEVPSELEDVSCFCFSIPVFSSQPQLEGPVR